MPHTHLFPHSLQRSLFASATALCLVLSSGTVSAGLIALYNFNGTTNDVSGNNRNPVAGTISGYTAGMQGQAGNFNGSTNRLQLPINVSPSLMHSLTMGVWVSALETTNRTGIMSADDNSPANYDRQIGIDNRRLLGSSGPALYSYSAFGGGSTGVLASGVAASSAFTFLAARYDGNTVTLFVDGQSFTANDTTDDDPIEYPQLWIGKNPSFDSSFQGALDNAFVFDEALSDAQIDAIRTGGESAILAVAVPEPATTGIAAGCMAVTFLRRRRRH